MSDLLPGQPRYEYSALPSRRRYRWPGGQTLAAYLAINVECFAYGTGAGPTLTPGMDPPSSEHRKYSWRDYGARVGIFRLLDALAQYELVPSFLLNAYVCRLYPDIVKAIADSGGEVIGHGRTNAEIQGPMWESQEADLIHESTRIVADTFGRPPAGWMSPGATQSPRTLDLLHEAGYRYTLDWPLDDQPVWLQCRSGRILSVPYPIEINDLPAEISRGHTARQFAAMALDHFEEMLAGPADTPTVYALSVHTFISGQPYRLRALREVLERLADARPGIWFTTPGAIAEHVSGLDPAGS